MRLNQGKVEQLNSTYQKIRKYEASNNVKFKECKICEGTGLYGYTKLEEGGYAWSGEYCNNCGGTGRVESNINNLVFICDKCKGTGNEPLDIDSCSRCGGFGIIDWARKLTGKNK